MRAILISLFLLGACAQTSTTTPPNTAEEATRQDTCGASRYRQFVGQDVSSIDRSTLPPRARVIMPGQMITMDFSAERLNIRVGPDQKVTEVGCF
ncbi:I78 family peptidase inhibitor [Terricaulis sp.]|uniref:I78 family peptidase inhibitor n=1 Tax=Terricaulis sp. TaxID=2768686 RepID=UPI003784E286